MNDSQQTDPHLTFISLLSKNEGIIRASVRAVIWRDEDIDEIMQRVSIIAWQKFETLLDYEGFSKWACVIARYEILKFKREKASDRFQLDPNLLEKILVEGEDESNLRSKRMTQLESCLKKLPEDRQHFILQSYRPGCTIKILAKELGKSQDGLYQLLRRIRLELKRCVDLQISTEDNLA